MNKILVDRLRAENPRLTTAEACKTIETVFNALRDVLDVSSGFELVRIPGFGTFRRKFRPERQVRNPRTGATSLKQAHFVITFKAAKGK